VKIETTALDGVLILTPARHQDPRGFFSEVWNRRALAEAGLDLDFVQDNQSLSREAGVIRGLHCQVPPHAQDKLVRVGRGRVLDVAVDIRVGSPTWAQWVAVELSAENGRQLLVPKGFLHGFVALEPDTELLYKCTDYYAKDCDRSVRFDDPAIGIDWGQAGRDPVLSDRDRAAPTLAEFDSPFRYEE